MCAMQATELRQPTTSLHSMRLEKGCNDPSQRQIPTTQLTDMSTIMMLHRAFSPIDIYQHVCFTKALWKASLSCNLDHGPNNPTTHLLAVLRSNEQIQKKQFGNFFLATTAKKRSNLTKQPNKHPQQINIHLQLISAIVVSIHLSFSLFSFRFFVFFFVSFVSFSVCLRARDQPHQSLNLHSSHFFRSANATTHLQNTQCHLPFNHQHLRFQHSEERSPHLWPWWGQHSYPLEPRAGCRRSTTQHLILRSRWKTNTISDPHRWSFQPRGQEEHRGGPLCQTPTRTTPRCASLYIHCQPAYAQWRGKECTCG